MEVKESYDISGGEERLSSEVTEVIIGNRNDRIIIYFRSWVKFSASNITEGIITYGTERDITYFQRWIKVPGF